MRILLLMVCIGSMYKIPLASQIDTFFAQKIDDINGAFMKRVKSEPHNCFYQREISSLKKQRLAMLNVLYFHLKKRLSYCKFVWEKEKSYDVSFDKKYAQEIEKIRAVYHKKIDTLQYASFKIKNYVRDIYARVAQNLAKQLDSFQMYMDRLDEHIQFLKKEIARDPLGDDTVSRFGRSKSKPVFPVVKEKNTFKQLSQSCITVQKSLLSLKKDLDFDYFKK